MKSQLGPGLNFIIWRRSLRGPVASLDHFDPRQSMDWKLHEQNIIQIVPLTEVERDMALNSLIVLHPCPEYVI